MREAIVWSDELLPPTERRLFRRLRVFVCRFSHATGEAVAAESEGAAGREGVGLVDSWMIDSVNSALVVVGKIGQ
jgi:hypothetical protein